MLLTIAAVMALLAAMPAADAPAAPPLGATATTTPSPFLTTADPATTILAEYPLRGGRLLVNFKRPGRVGWATVLPGTQIGQEPLTLGGEVRDTLTIRPPEPHNGAEARVAAQQLAASGWTEDAQLALLDLVGKGIPPLAAIDQVEPQRSSAAAEGDPNPDEDFFEEDCAYDSLETNNVNARGCYQRYWGQEDQYEAYTVSTSQAYAGIEDGDGDVTRLKIVTTAHSYAHATMRRYDPGSTISQGSCGSVNLGIAEYGVSVSQSQQICPEKLEPTIYSDGTVYGVDWRGSITSGTRHTELVEAARLDKGNPPNPYPPAQLFGFAYHMDFRAQPECDEYQCAGLCGVSPSASATASDQCDPAYTAKKIVSDALKG